MRGNMQNTGVSPVVGLDRRGDHPENLEVRHFRTGNGIFSTPIIAHDERIYIGSADGYFYALDPLAGEELWRFPTGEVIDSAGCLGEDGTIYMASCDACLYSLDRNGKERWRIDMLKDRQHFSPSTTYWWEANVCFGPNGMLYAPSDDFYLYAVDPAGEVKWAGLTGLLIWTAPAFSPPSSPVPLVYVVSFDTCAYGFNADTGEVVWRESTGNFVASSPAVDAEGVVHFGSFDGGVYALDGQTGKIRWRLQVGGPIYASPAIAPDGMLYVGSSDGVFYAVSTREHETRWTFYSGDAIRSSAALGPDPEGMAEYLIYFGSGNGQVYALDPQGKRRWSYNTLTRAPNAEYPNINASIGMGHHGLATASANGDVIYIPYEAYRREKRGFDVEPSDGYPERGAHWYAISPGGTVAESPVPPSAEQGEPQELSATQTISLRPVISEQGRSRPGAVDPASVEVKLTPDLPHRVTVLPDRSQINVIPLEPAASGQSYSASFRATDQSGVVVEGGQRLTALAAPSGPAASKLAELPFSITHMSVHSPPIVPAFDQIGIASLTIDVRVLEADSVSGQVVAWGLLKFGTTETGDAVGVPIPRHLYYALGGIYRDGHLILESRDCTFELTGFPVPLDYLRFSGSFDESGAPAAGTSMVAEYKLRGVSELLGKGTSGRRGGFFFGGGGGWAEAPTPGELFFACGRGVRSTQTVLGWIGSFVGSWFPRENVLQSLPQMLRAAWLTLPLAWDLFGRGIHRPWGLFDTDGQFTGVGTFRAAPLVKGGPSPGAVTKLTYEKARRRVVAELSPQGPTAVPGILIIDAEENCPLYLDYNRQTRTRRGADAWTVELDLPLSTKTRGRKLRAVVLVDTVPVGELTLS
jgi:outer membrane protein assembly factor BamB